MDFDAREMRDNLFIAINNNDIDFAETILNLMPAYVNTFDSNGYTPLCIASSEGYGEMVNFLLEYMADPNLPNDNEEKDSPLMCAIGGNNVSNINIVEILLLNGANVNYENFYLNTPLMFSCGVDEGNLTENVMNAFKLLPILKLLIHWGADPFKVNQINWDGNPMVRVSEACEQNEANPLLIDQLKKIEDRIIMDNALIKSKQQLTLSKMKNSIIEKTGQHFDDKLLENISEHLSRHRPYEDVERRDEIYRKTEPQRLTKARQRLSLSQHYLTDDLTEKINEHLSSMPYDPNVMRRIKEDEQKDIKLKNFKKTLGKHKINRKYR